MITGIYYDLFTHVFRIAGVQSTEQFGIIWNGD